MAHRFVIIDESLMPDGFWVKVDGIDLSQFEKNPIMYFMHMRPGDYGNTGKDMVHAIGTWTGWKVETVGDFKALTAEAVFDEGDDFAQKIAKKVEAGIYKMASAGLRTKAWSADEKDLRPNQSMPTLVNSMLMEASIVDRGRNLNAVKLYDDNNEDLKLSDVKTALNVNTIQKPMKDLERLAEELGCNPQMEEVLKSVRELRQSEADMQTELEQVKTARAKEKAQALESAVLELSEKDKELVLDLAETDLDKAMKLAKRFQERAEKPAEADVKLREIPKTGEQGGQGETFKELHKNNPKRLAYLQQNEPDYFAALYLAEYGKKPNE